VTGAELLSVAAFLEGRFAQAFPSFGSERMGAPVMAFCRIADAPIRLREPVMDPDAVLIQDATLLHSVEVFQGLRPEGYVLINTGKTSEALGLGSLCARLPRGHVRTVAATDLALKHIGRPIPNAALLAGFAALTGVIGMHAIERALRDRFDERVADANVAAATAAFATVKEQAQC
jgi:pyruvate ferredoxin oxidoreductase gamma subunit